MSRGDLSECSTDQDSTNEEAHIKRFAKHMLRGKIFVGTYSQKRLVENLNAYRDIVLINNTESDLLRDLNAVVKRIQGCFTQQWIGYTSCEEIGAHCLWVDLEQQVFGSYWFKVKTVRFRDKEICLELKQVRPLEEVKLSESREEIQLLDVVQRKLHEFSEAGLELLTPANLKNSIVFLSVLTITLLTGLVQLGRYLLDFSLKLLRETSFFVHSITPFAISIVRMLEKVIGGFYILLAMIWRDYRNPQPTGNRNMLTHTQTTSRNNMLTYKESNKRNYNGNMPMHSGNPMNYGYGGPGNVYTRQGVFIEEIE